MIGLLISDRKVRGSQAHGHLVLFLTLHQYILPPQTSQLARIYLKMSNRIFFICFKGQPSTVECLVNRKRFVHRLQKKMVYKDDFDFAGLHGHSELLRSAEESLCISRHLKKFGG
jgi:hypothetical protein